MRGCASSAEYIVIVLISRGDSLGGSKTVGGERRTEARETSAGLRHLCLHGVQSLLKIRLIALETGSMLAGLSNICLVLGLQLLVRRLLTFCLVLVLI